MADTKAKSDIQVRLVVILDACDKKKFQRAASYFTEDCCAMFNNQRAYNGRTEVETGLRTLWKDQMITKSALKEINHFELYGANKAYTTMFIESVDNRGKPAAKFRIIGMWKQIENVWYMETYFMNYLETSPRDKAFQEIKKQATTAYEKLSDLDLEGFLKVQAENTTLMMNGYDEWAGKTTVREIMSKMLTTKYKYEVVEISNFDLLKDDTAFAIFTIKVFKPTGEHSSTIRDSFLWKKTGDEWLILRDCMNAVPKD